MKKKQRNASKVLGILSIIGGILSPAVGIILSIIGLSITKDEEHKDRDIALNLIGMGVSVIVFLISFAYLLSL